MADDQAGVLLIEDDEDIRELVALWLAGAGFAVRAEPDGERGLAAVRAQPPDVVVLDWMMPGIDGLEVCRHLRGDPRTASLRVLVLTARAGIAEGERVLAAGADAYLIKPLTRARLLDEVRALVDATPGNGRSTK